MIRKNPDLANNSTLGSVNPANVVIKVVYAGVEVAFTKNAIIVLGNDGSRNYLIPTEDIKMQFLKPMYYHDWDHSKGKVRYWKLCIRGREADAAAWSFINPEISIRNYVSFNPENVDKYVVTQK